MVTNLCRKLIADRRGATAIMIAVMAALLIGFTSLGFEVVQALQIQRHMQSAADSAVLAAVTANKTGYPSDPTQEGYGVAAKAGYNHSSGDDCTTSPTVYLYSDALSGTTPCLTIPSGDVGIRIKQPFTLRLAKVLFPADFTLHVDAVAYWSGKSGCILALSTTRTPALWVSGNSNTNVQSCDTYINSDASNAVKIDGTASFGCNGAGGYSLNIQGTTFQTGGGTNTCPTDTGQPPTSDPYAATTTPSPTSPCTSTTNGTLNPATSGGVVTFCNKVMLTNGKTLNLCPGVYIVTAGGNNAVSTSSGSTLQSVSNSPLLSDGVTANPTYWQTLGFTSWNAVCPNNTGNGVAIVLTGSPASNTGSASLSGGTIKLVGLQSSADGLPAGIVFWQNQGATLDNSDAFTGSTSQFIDGVLYLPQGDISWAGSTTTAGGCTEMIAQTIKFTGGAVFQNAGCPQNTIDFGGSPKLLY